MVDWNKLAKQAGDVVKKRGGTQSVREDASELEEIAQGEGTLSEKAKRAAKALKEPGAHHDPPPPTPENPA